MAEIKNQKVLDANSFVCGSYSGKTSRRVTPSLSIQSRVKIQKIQ